MSTKPGQIVLPVVFTAVLYFCAVFSHFVWVLCFFVYIIKLKNITIFIFTRFNILLTLVFFHVILIFLFLFSF